MKKTRILSLSGNPKISVEGLKGERRWNSRANRLAQDFYDSLTGRAHSVEVVKVVVLRAGGPDLGKASYRFQIVILLPDGDKLTVEAEYPPRYSPDPRVIKTDKQIVGDLRARCAKALGEELRKARELVAQLDTMQGWFRPTKEESQVA